MSAAVEPSGGQDALPAQAPGGHRLICIGDVHGCAEPLSWLWSNLERAYGAELEAATVVFLGDYCDRGQQTREAIDFMICLRDARPMGKTVFIAGNHDLGMAAFLGCLPTDFVHPDLESTRLEWFKDGFWKGEVSGGMHYQGRRWGGSEFYEAKATFESYGVAWDPESADLADRLREAVPSLHKQFLSSLLWVYEQEVPWPPGLVTCVHAGLMGDHPLQPQLAALRQRDLSAPALFAGGDPGRIASFSCRDSVLDMHPELDGRSLLVSGHHSQFFVKGDRIVNDRSGGYASPAHPLEAIVLPERRVVGAFDDTITAIESSLPGASQQPDDGGARAAGCS